MSAVRQHLRRFLRVDVSVRVAGAEAAANDEPQHGRMEPSEPLASLDGLLDGEPIGP